MIQNQFYNPESDNWYLTRKFSQTVANAELVSVNNKLIVMGGKSGTSYLNIIKDYTPRLIEDVLRNLNKFSAASEEDKNIICSAYNTQASVILEYENKGYSLSAILNSITYLNTYKLNPESLNVIINDKDILNISGELSKALNQITLFSKVNELSVEKASEAKELVLDKLPVNKIEAAYDAYEVIVTKNSSLSNLTLEEVININEQKIKKAGENFSQVETFGRLLLLNFFQKLGYFNKTGNQIKIQELKEKINLIDKYNKLFDVLLIILQKEKIIEEIKTFDDDYYISRNYEIIYPEVDHIIDGDGTSIKIGQTKLTFFQAQGHNNDGLFMIIEPIGVFFCGDYFSDIEFPFIYFSSYEYEKTILKLDDILSHFDIKLLVTGHGNPTSNTTEMKKRQQDSLEYIVKMRDYVLSNQNEAIVQLIKDYKFPGNMKKAHHSNTLLMKKELGESDN